MIAVVKGEEKVFLVEEWIHTDEVNRQFLKYINNRLPISCLSITASSTAVSTAEFLTFAQHVQWQKTNFAAFTSDYQGAADILTDPQITSNPYVLFASPVVSSLSDFIPSTLGPNLFGDGNLPAAFNDFRMNHHCNELCRFFDLTLDVPQDSFPEDPYPTND
jgi:hypothetical protein